MDLQHYNFEIKYRKGCNNQVAVALSRRSYPEHPDEENEVAAVKVSEVNTGTEAIGKDRTFESIQVEFFYDDYTMVAPLEPVIARPELSNLPATANLQQNCPDFGNMYRFLTQGILPADNDQSSKKRVRVDNGEKWIKQFCLPQALREDALLSYHDSFVGGAHLGIERVYHALSLKYFWPKMHQSIENYIRSCDRCQRIKIDTKGKEPPLNPLPVDTTFERWHMDFLKLSKTNEGIIQVHTTLKQNGLVERTNSTLIQAVRAYSDKDQNNWPNKLPGNLMAFRNSPSTQSTEYSPFSMVFGKEINLPFDASILPEDNLSKDAKHHLEEIISNFKIIQDLAAKMLSLNKQK
ncbi:unnamed protein product [Mytilus coruscus]|uniref:Integrase zinc-binding domain-containing protein n=1 Tax=Mytilus coruscus TaxID=42192 RepID=A0A6J8EQG2_MYTCO|nr:unnamed protein product [Mytilus coruscus]